MPSEADTSHQDNNPQAPAARAAVSSAMDTVTEARMAIAMAGTAAWGCARHLHRGQAQQVDLVSGSERA